VKEDEVEGEGEVELPAESKMNVVRDAPFNPISNSQAGREPNRMLSTQVAIHRCTMRRILIRGENWMIIYVL